MARIELGEPDHTPSQRGEAALRDACRSDLRRLADLFPPSADRDLLCPAELQVRDAVLGTAAKKIGTDPVFRQQSSFQPDEKDG